MTLTSTCIPGLSLVETSRLAIIAKRRWTE
jgi:hypothetical protein